MEGVIAVIVIIWIIYTVNKQRTENIKRAEAKRKTDTLHREIKEEKIVQPELIIRKTEIEKESLTAYFGDMTLVQFGLLEVIGHRATFFIHRTFNNEWFWRLKEWMSFEYGEQVLQTPREVGREIGRDAIDDDWNLSEEESREIIENRGRAELHWCPVPKKFRTDGADIHDWIDFHYDKCVEFFKEHPGMTPKGPGENPKAIWSPPTHGTDAEIEESAHRCKELDDWYRNRIDELYEKNEDTDRT